MISQFYGFIRKARKKVILKNNNNAIHVKNEDYEVLYKLILKKYTNVKSKKTLIWMVFNQPSPKNPNLAGSLGSGNVRGLGQNLLLPCAAAPERYMILQWKNI